MKLSVIILNYNVRYFLQLCLSSVQEALADLDAEIIVIDNNSSDDSCNMVKELFPQIKLIENKENVGFAKANNQAVAIAKGDYICILNPDTVVAEDTFQKVLEFADDKEGLGIVGCRLIDGKGNFLPESKRNLPVIKVAFQKQLGNSELYYANQIKDNETGKVPILVGAYMFMKRKLFHAVQGFAEDYFMYGEDIDLSYKVLNAGFSNYYFSETTIIHFKGESTLKDAKYAKRFYGAMQIFYKKHFRQNWFYDALISVGVKLANMSHQVEKPQEATVDQYLIISDTEYVALAKLLDKKVNVQKDLFDIKKHTEIIFDAHYLSYKKIIQHMNNKELNSLATFKIMPKNTRFIVGSNSSKQQGEVLIF